jgi:DNA-binding GntR family transcriptional regulator
MVQTALVESVANQIIQLIRTGQIAGGEQLVERKLAEQLRISRSPVNKALIVLAKGGAVRPSGRGGFVAAMLGKKLPKLAIGNGETRTDQVYAQLVEDRLNDELPDRISESELIRRYDLTRSQLSGVLRRATNEGWMERLPGNGWKLLPVLTSLDAYRDSYRFRLTIEPAAILEPSFVLNTETLRYRLTQQKSLAAGLIKRASDAEIFEMNSGLHEAIVECSNNRFFIDSFKRLNRLRRLMEYRQKLDRVSAASRCLEHVELVELLLAGKREKAAAKLRSHLASVGAAKSLNRRERRLQA